METNEEKLRNMLTNATEQLEDFIAMGKAVGATLDYSIGSIDAVEKILLQTNATPEKDEDLFFDAWLYTGMTVQKAVQGTWIISEEEDDTNGYPAIRYNNIYDDLFCPLTAVSDFLHTKQKGGILSTLHL